MNDFQSDQINDLVAALARAQKDIVPAVKDSVNPHFKSKFADLNSVWTACRGALNANGLVITQAPYQMQLGLFLVTTLAHISGQWLRSYTPIINTKGDAQGLGSAITYARRYGLSAMVGVVPEDDDAEGAVQQPIPQKPAKPTPAKAPMNDAIESYMTLKVLMDADKVDSSLLNEFLSSKSKDCGKTTQDVVNSALKKYDTFKSAYLSYLSQCDQEAVAV